MTSPHTERRGLLAGAARVVITPPVGIRMLGYTVQAGCSESIERELTATALVLSDGQVKVVFIACDVVFIQSPHVDRMRETDRARKLAFLCRPRRRHGQVLGLLRARGEVTLSFPPVDAERETRLSASLW